MRALLPLALVVVLAAGCTSSDSSGPSGSPTGSSTGSAPPAPTMPVLVADSPDDLSSGCVKGTGGKTRRVTVWQPTFTAQGGDVVLRKFSITGRGVTPFDTQGAFVDAGTRSIADELPWPVDPSLLPDGAAVFTGVRGTQVREGRTILPVLGVEVLPRSVRRGARLGDVVETYQTGDGTGSRTVSAPLDVSYPDAGGRCSKTPTGTSARHG